MKPRARQLLALLLVAAGAAFFALGGHRVIDFGALKATQAQWQAQVDARPLAAAAVFVAAYATVALLWLPGAGVLSLAGGALFGLAEGSALVLAASAVGGTLAMLLARTLLRDLVRARFGAALGQVDRGVARDGAFYLAALRLAPLFPFFIVNPLFGLTALPARTFFVVSVWSMAPGTLVYVNAGTQLAKLNSPADVLSWPLALSFLALAVFPLLAKKAVDAWQTRRVYAPWAKARPARYDRNLVVVGAGAAGLVASLVAAATKASVTLVEAGRMGGDCLNTGCVPSKALIRIAAEVQAARRAGADVRVDFARLMARVADAVREVEPHDSAARYRGLGVEVLEGHACIVDPWHVRVETAAGSSVLLSTRAIVVAAGARPAIPPLPGLAEVAPLTSETLWSMAELPRRLLVLGGGPVGCELAQAFARLGSEVTLVELAPQLLPREDTDVGAFVQRVLDADGVRVCTGRRALRCEGATLVVEGEGGEEGLAFDRLLCATGRRARLQGYGLEALGLADGRTLEVDEFLQTRLPNILAAGDVAGPWQFTHAAAHQGWHAAVNALVGDVWRVRVDGSVMPACTFTDPEVARVGLNVAEARAAGVECELTRVDLAELDRAIVDGRADGWVQVLTPPGSDRILGATVVGPRAGETIALFALAMRNRLGLGRILATVHAYPTYAEAAQKVAAAWRRDHAPQRLLAWAERWHRWRRGA